MIVDTVIIGDTPFAIAVQRAVRRLGDSTVLIYTGDVNLKYFYTEDLDVPQVHCRYPIHINSSKSHGVLLASSYRTHFRSKIGGDYRVLYDITDQLDHEKPNITLRICMVDKKQIEKNCGIVGNPEVIALDNKFVSVGDELIHFNKLIVTESLRKFLESIKRSVPLESRNVGVLLEEHVNLLKAGIYLSPLNSDSEYPIFSMTRGFLTTHLFTNDVTKVNITLDDYIKIPTQHSRDIIEELESKDVFCVGGRAMWNTGLTLTSELIRLQCAYCD